MVSNFEFLKKSDKNLYQIVSDAEFLYRDEYFEQCITQTRRFAENVCKKTLGDKRTTEETFDQMLATLKDQSNNTVQEHEFINDLYFLKKCGNNAVHSKKVNQDGINALECLQRAFEVAINYMVYTLKEDKSILNLHFDCKLLATGRKTRNFEKRYQKAEEAEKKSLKKKKETSKNSTSKKRKVKTPQQSGMKSCKKKPKYSLYWIFVTVISVLSLFTIVALLIIS